MNKIFTLIIIVFFATQSMAQSSFGSASFGLPEPERPNVTRTTSTQVDFDISILENGGADILNWTFYFDDVTPPVTVETSNSLRGFSQPYTFFDAASGLSPSTTYYYQLCATNVVGTACSSIGSITTLASGESPTVLTVSATDITTATATLNGNVTGDGGATVTSRGFYWSTSSTPTSGGSSGSGTGTYSLGITSLSPATTYYYRAYAVNSNGTALGDIESFTTSTPTVVPLVSTTVATNITTTSASSGGTVNYNGGSVVTERGVVFGTSANPDKTDNYVTSGSGDGQFTTALSGLIANTTYYYRAYAINATGTGYGTEFSFITTTDDQAPTVELVYATVLSYEDISVTGNVLSDGGSTVTERGIIIDTSPPTYPTDKISSGSGGTGIYTQVIEGLPASTTYYIKCYATNSVGTSLSEQVTVTTPSCDNPSIVSFVADNPTSTGIDVSSEVISIRPLSQRRIYYSTTNPATVSDSYVDQSLTAGSETTTISGLNVNTMYYFLLSTTNECGTDTDTDSGTTLACTPPIINRDLGTASTSDSILSMTIGALNGDLVVIHIVSKDGTETFTTPSGWTRLYSGASSAISRAVYYKFYYSSTSESVDIEGKDGAEKFGMSRRYSNVSGITYSGGFTTSTTKYINAEVNSVSGEECNILIASIILTNASTPVIDYGTGWCCGASGNTIYDGGFGYSYQYYIYETTTTSSTTDWNFGLSDYNWVSYSIW